MRGIKLVSVLALVMALGAIAATTASAEIEFLPGEAGTLFTGKSAKAVLQIKGEGRIECSASSVLEKEGELLSKTTALFVVHFTGCKASATGTAVNSLGDETGIILVHVEVKTCTITTSPLVGGLLLEILPLHLEVPSISSLIDVRGKFVAKLEPENKKAKEFKLVIEQKEGKQTIEGCLAFNKKTEKNETEKETLESSTNGGTFLQSGEEAKEGTLLFKVEEEFMT